MGVHYMYIHICFNKFCFIGLVVEAKQIREHHWKPYIEKQFKRKVVVRTWQL